MTAIGHRDHTSDSHISIDRIIETTIAAGVALLVIIGFVTSYATLRTLAATDGGFPPWLAPAVPLSFDLGIIVLSLKIVASARQGRQAITLRALVAALSASTVAINSSAATDTTGRLLHAVPPAMFIICFESLASGARRNCHTKSRPTTRTMVWLLAPFRTLRTWRQQILSADEPEPRPGRQASRPSTTAAPAPSPPRPPSKVAEDSRLECVSDAIRRMPSISAPQLREHLKTHGHDVSVRTAQRLKATASPR